MTLFLVLNLYCKELDTVSCKKGPVFKLYDVVQDIYTNNSSVSTQFAFLQISSTVFLQRFT